MIKPEGSDLVNIDDLNGNFDVIDTQMKRNADIASSKQDALTFDPRPVRNSKNPVESGGLYSALQNKQDTLSFDEAPKNGSYNIVFSNGIFTALQGKQDSLTFDNAPTTGSSNPVKSGGISAALQAKQNKLTPPVLFFEGINNGMCVTFGIYHFFFFNWII